MLLNLVLRLGEHPINLKEVNVVAGSPMVRNLVEQCSVPISLTKPLNSRFFFPEGFHKKQGLLMIDLG